MHTITDREFHQLAEFIKKNYGINLKEEKRALVVGRLQSVLIQKNMKSFSEYFEHVLSDKTGEAAAELVNKITTNYTFYMREPDHFYYFRDVVLPYLVKTVRNKDLRIWSAGCSSGEEPYTLAMIIDEYFRGKKAGWDTRILATDISGRMLEKAKKGIYDYDSIAKLPPQWRLNYFNRLDDNSYSVAGKIRNEVIFRKFNLVDGSFPFKRKFHVIFCRNVMIYFDMKTKDELVERFYNALEYGGYLFIGHSESISRARSRFRYILPAVYRKI
jgi:chemotaxis protein methyltransferase CheR